MCDAYIVINKFLYSKYFFYYTRSFGQQCSVRISMSTLIGSLRYLQTGLRFAPVRFDCEFFDFQALFPTQFVSCESLAKTDTNRMVNRAENTTKFSG